APLRLAEPPERREDDLDAPAQDPVDDEANEHPALPVRCRRDRSPARTLRGRRDGAVTEVFLPPTAPPFRTAVAPRPPVPGRRSACPRSRRSGDPVPRRRQTKCGAAFARP